MSNPLSDSQKQERDKHFQDLVQRQVRLETGKLDNPQEIEVELPKRTEHPKKAYLYGQHRAPVLIDAPIEIETPKQKQSPVMEGPTVITESGQEFSREDLEEL